MCSQFISRTSNPPPSASQIINGVSEQAIVNQKKKGPQETFNTLTQIKIDILRYGIIKLNDHPLQGQRSNQQAQEYLNIPTSTLNRIRAQLNNRLKIVEDRIVFLKRLKLMLFFSTIALWTIIDNGLVITPTQASTTSAGVTSQISKLKIYICPTPAQYQKHSIKKTIVIPPLICLLPVTIVEMLVYPNGFDFLCAFPGKERSFGGLEQFKQQKQIIQGQLAQ